MRVIFVTGGARSGKSDFGLGEADKVKGRKAYIATAEALDEEMAERIAAHRKVRSGAWDTIEEPTELPGAVREAALDYEVIVIDCLTLWLSNILSRNPRAGEAAAADASATLVQTLLELKNSSRDYPYLYVIANEVGMGIVPSNAAARRFRDLAGRLNQQVAGAADEVFLMVSGLPVRVKGKG